LVAFAYRDYRHGSQLKGSNPGRQGVHPAFQLAYPAFVTAPLSGTARIKSASRFINFLQEIGFATGQSLVAILQSAD
jgi:hypothetical protein